MWSGGPTGVRALLKSGAGKLSKEVLEQTLTPALARQVLRNGGKAAVRLAPVLAVVEFAIDQGATSAAFKRGELTRQQHIEVTAGNVGNAAGGLGGAALGATLGSAILPGIGTLLGGIFGGIFGGVGGRQAGMAIAR
ncbi:MAG: hypothetical protein WBP56_13370 [Polyangia bacterium]